MVGSLFIYPSLFQNNLKQGTEEVFGIQNVLESSLMTVREQVQDSSYTFNLGEWGKYTALIATGSRLFPGPLLFSPACPVSSASVCSVFG